MAEEVVDDNVKRQAIAETTGRFGNDFLKVVANDNPGNLITSPLSAQVLLAMAAYGAGGKTASQMRSVLLIPSDNEFGQSGYQALIECLNSVEGVELRLANKVYTASQFEVKPAFKELTACKFFSSSQELDFNDSSAAATAINTWCEEQTNKRIKNVVNPGSLDPNTLLILVNAVYFKGQWEKKFDASLTQERPFHVNETVTKMVPTMFIKNTFLIGQVPGLEAILIEIPYQGKEISMVIILPEEISGLKTLQKNLHQVNVRQILQDSYRKDVELYLPKFKIESTLDLKETLKQLGMPDMFNDEADFSGIADIPLKVSDVIQKAFIEVNEEGSEAAAVTRMKIKKKCSKPPKEFDANRPFYYQIRSTSWNVPLFTGLYFG